MESEKEQPKPELLDKRMRSIQLIAEGHPIVCYDGVCGFCQRVVQFILPRDREGRFRFTAIQSDVGQSLLSHYGLAPQALNTFVLIENNRAYTRSTAGLRVFRGLGGAWKLLYVFIAVPKPLRNAVYSWIARNRYRWFGKTDACLIPSRDMRERFLDT